MAWLLIILGLIIVYAALNFFSQRKLMKVLTEEEFKAGYRKAQLIDVREQDEYEGGHILGSRNIPLSQLRQRYKEIRNDQPVYLYCQNTVRSGRAAQLLKKKGYTNLNTLKGGFKQWTGKIKTKK
ncbi:rhodanese-like domain-containing protein [Metabacillus fastidiosus]|uniref:rhodanese-like domain-containing protein n=1 Tax=Metabacillus fastidiosus TaxID=1458 RepID=UPI002DB564FE|nr:rhodanese-like domain-containing protein [Metabacillus fastidiosus]MEC2075393.1 rhodanese-like domain-containing protein [Metabacillus fastidiosus]MED4453522.1 rhodanese-like domain-containing protein [Metabacillus fastidiosus]MED4530683.1 rhodanese-like domain-containing protein [Metabacillus fastidiosus]